MMAEEQSPFGNYSPEPQTAGALPRREAAEPGEVETKKYGIGKPRRIIVRGTIATDKGPQEQQE